ncbi:MAG: ATP-binding protein, partial [Actinomycetota bacterium]|nr:ATP-binding protein [Actinomycetota bacterium]
MAGRITAEAYRAGRMIEDLLDLSRIEANGLPDLRLVSLGAVVRSAVERVRPSADMKSVEIAVSLRAGGVPQVRGDEAQLVSAVSNLLDNAVKYSERKSSVKVKARRGEDGRAEISVRDRGIGIPSADLERIFERFYRVDQARSRDTGGT